MKAWSAGIVKQVPAGTPNTSISFKGGLVNVACLGRFISLALPGAYSAITE